MNKRTKKSIFYLLGIISSACGGFYAFWFAMFYAWMNAKGSLSAEKAALWSYSALALAVIFFIVLIYLIIKLVKFRKAQNVT